MVQENTAILTPCVDATNYIGIDLHSDNAYVCVLRNAVNSKTGRLESRVIFRSKIRLTDGVEEFRTVMAPYCAVAHQATVESTYNWYGLADLFEAQGWNLCLADPTTVKACRAKHTNDETDAQFLADKLRRGEMSTYRIMSRNARAFRDLVRLRGTLIQDRACESIKLINMINNHTYSRMTRPRLEKLAEDWIDNGVIPENLADMLTHPYIAPKVKAFIDGMRHKTEEIESVEKCIAESHTALPQNCHRYMALLQSIKGCGVVLSTAIAAEIDDIARFADAKHFVSYCRLAPTSRMSNGKTKGESNPKNGNRYLSWALTELANLVVRFNPAAEKKFNKLLRTHENMRARAIRPIAAMLAHAIFYMLRDHKLFEEVKLFGMTPASVPAKKTVAEKEAPSATGAPAQNADASSAQAETPKRKRGRPRKTTAAQENVAAAALKRRPGRPRKTPPQQSAVPSGTNTDVAAQTTTKQCNSEKATTVPAVLTVPASLEYSQPAVGG